MVILREMVGQSQGLELVLAISFHEEATTILECFRYDHNHIAEILRLNSDFYDTLRLDHIKEGLAAALVGSKRFLNATHARQTPISKHIPKVEMHTSKSESGCPFF